MNYHLKEVFPGKVVNKAPDHQHRRGRVSALRARIPDRQLLLRGDLRGGLGAGRAAAAGELRPRRRGREDPPLHPGEPRPHASSPAWKSAWWRPRTSTGARSAPSTRASSTCRRASCEQYPMLLSGGMWGTIELTYDETEVHNKKIRPFKVDGLHAVPDLGDRPGRVHREAGASSATTSGSTSWSTPSASIPAPMTRREKLLYLMPRRAAGRGQRQHGRAGPARDRQDLPLPQHLLLRPRALRRQGHAGQPVHQPATPARSAMVGTPRRGGLRRDRQHRLHRSQGAGQHHAGLHAGRQVQPGQEGDPGVRLHRPGRQPGRAGQAAAREVLPPLRAAARLPAGRGVHRPPARLPARLGDPQDRPDRSQQDYGFITDYFCEIMHELRRVDVLGESRAASSWSTPPD